MRLRPLSLRLLAAGLLGGPSATPAQAPAFREVAGHAFGERITLHHEMVRYLERLAATSPRVRVVEQGWSWEGRKLLLAVVTAPENHARLDSIRLNSLRLADPRATPPEQAAAIIRAQPVIVWFGGSIHGFELSGSEGALKLLERLTTRDDSATLAVLRSAVVLIDPMLNPDGRDAFAHRNHENIGRVPSADRNDWSNDFTPWQALQFRTGHYYFDTNRDWFAHTQRETRDRMATLHAWRPQVAVDMHEMGADNEFYFDPAGEPVNPHFPGFAVRWFQTFGAAYAQAFDSAGFEYMTRERYNYFYPGYTSNRGYHGAVAMLFEQGSSRGLALERADGTVRTLTAALEQQYVAAWTAVRVAVRNREALLREYYESQRQAVAAGEAGAPRRYLILDEGDRGLVRELVRLLERNAIEVGVLREEVRLANTRDRTGAVAGTRAFAAGTFVVEAAQPAGRLLRALLEPHVPLPDPFLRRARAYVERDENPRFYDITAWSLPLLFNVAVYATADARALPVAPRAEPAPPGGPGERAAYAYLLDGAEVGSVAALYQLRTRGYRVGVLTAPSRIGALRVAGGTGIVRVGQNDSTVHAAVREVAARLGVTVTPVATGLSDSGFPALGSGDFTFNLEPPKIAILAEEPIQGYSFGWAWYTLDRQYEIPTAILRVRSLGSTALERYNVLVIPAASSEALVTAVGRAGIDRVRRWVREGGTLVTIGEASEFARDTAGLGLVALRSWYDSGPTRRAQRFAVPGAIFRVTLDRERWLAAGYDAGEFPALVNSSRLYLPPDGAPSSSRRVVARYPRDGALKLSGHAWPESLERLPGAVFAYEERVGQGRVIVFAEDPNFRGYWRGANRMFLNAVVLGPSAP
ncbi:MAG: hypothetical protein HYS40_01040 [Gemmatimonadetes bacterium]|nr:hypothetical protein [Gemmatimonadota bacterium]